MNYNDLVSIARESARDNVRLHLTNGVRGQILNNEIAISQTETELKNINKNIARATYALSKVDAADPDAEENTKDLNAKIKQMNEVVVNVTKELETYKAAIVKLNTDIVDIANGSKKVSTETLQTLSCKYLDTLNRELMLETVKAAVSKK